MNIRGFVVAAIAGGAVFVIWLFVGLTMTAGVPLLFCLVTAGLGSALIGCFVLLYMTQGQRPTADLAAVAIVLVLLLPLTAVLYGRLWGERKPAAAAEDTTGENGIVAVKLVESQPHAYVESTPAAPATPAPAEVPAVPIQVTEVVPGKAWRFTLTGPTDLGGASAHVRAASEATVRLHGGRTYRFRAPSVPRGTIHVTTRYTGEGALVKDAVVPGSELPHGLTKIFPVHETVATVWQSGPRVGPVEILVEETGESHAAGWATVARKVDSRPVVP